MVNIVLAHHRQHVSMVDVVSMLRLGFYCGLTELRTIQTVPMNSKELRINISVGDVSCRESPQSLSAGRDNYREEALARPLQDAL